ncbi:MAG: DNA repair protein RecN [Bdellovibrionales bacterium]|nr:DNA repair protein RecN [Bdellovibrionales bacterium]
MLETLKIRNLAVIDSAEIPFAKGLNILSGETGAGKSIVIEAISLILGSRASNDLIRSGCDEAVVEGLFDLTDSPWMLERLETLGLPNETQLLIRRVVHKTGKHRIHINGQLATLSILQQLCEGLVDLCGQHEHQSLIRPATQLDLLDRYGGLKAKLADYEKSFDEFQELTREKTELEQAEADRLRRADFLNFQIAELKNAALQEGEDSRLGAEKQLLQSAEGRVGHAEAARVILESEDIGILNQLRAATGRIRSLATLDASDLTGEMLKGLERSLAEAEEVSLSLNRYLGQVELNSGRLEEVQERLALIADLRRKYGTSVSEMLATLSRLEKESESLNDLGARLSEVTQRLSEVGEEAQKKAAALSKSRKSVAGLLSDSVTAEVRELKMGDASFKISMETSSLTRSGTDLIQFVIQTNRGESARPLGKIASGGELSRLMLSIRRVIADRGGIGVYLFDEIDSGIGGETAFVVGKKLKTVASFNQVICITHLPQVAAFADHHLSVRKRAEKDRTITEVVELSLKDRREELARMLAGPKLTSKSLENAGELMELAVR